MAGAETSLVLMATALRSRFEVAVACPVPSRLSEVLTHHEVRSYGLPSPPRRPLVSPLCGRYWSTVGIRLMQAVRTFRPDVIHANNLCAGPVSLAASLTMRTRSVLHARDFVHRPALCRACGRFFDKIIAVSFAVREALARARVDPRKIRVIYNTLDGARTESSGARDSPSAEGTNRKTFVFGHVGQFVPWKNHPMFLQAASRVANVLPTARFLFVGDDIFGRDMHYRQKVVEAARRSRQADRITFTGWVQNMDRIWPGMDCLVHTADREPFGRVVIEAMANRVPVLAVDAGGPAEVIRNGRTGILVPRDDVDALAQAMLRVASDRNEARRLADTAHRHVRSAFAPARSVEALQDVYDEILTP
jgi:glycosyltransferase involved in cell wall biosynthesis